MISIITGALIISLLHAVIPNHWLPVIAIGRKENWSLKEVSSVTLICALAHGLSTILIGILLSVAGSELNEEVSQFTTVVAPVILVLMGFIFIYRHHKHKHFHVDSVIQRKRTKTRIVIALTVAMFFSPCLEIEAYFLLAGAKSIWLVITIALSYLFITTVGMLILVTYAYKGLLKLNWHSIEHNAGIITGVTLVATGIISFFIH